MWATSGARSPQSGALLLPPFRHAVDGFKLNVMTSALLAGRRSAHVQYPRYSSNAAALFGGLSVILRRVTFALAHGSVMLCRDNAPHYTLPGGDRFIKIVCRIY